MARVALVAFLVGMMVLGYCSYMLPDSVWQEQTLTPFAYSTLCLFRELAMLTAGLSIAVLARSRTAYRLTRPLAVKIVLFALALIPLLYLSEMELFFFQSLGLQDYSQFPKILPAHRNLSGLPAMVQR